mgnify:CR=1 FL=1
MTLELTLKPNTLVDFAFGKVIAGKEMQVFAEYFPIIAPVLQECGIQPMQSFAVLATNNTGLTPEQGALTQVPSAEKFAQFHADPRFIEARPIRDEAMEFLTDGNLFNASDRVVNLNTDSHYAVIFAEGNPMKAEPMLTLEIAQDSPKQVYANKSLTLHLWSEQAEQLLNDSADKAEVFKIRFNPASA